MVKELDSNDNNEIENNGEENTLKLSKEDLRRAYWSFEIWAQACCSYERLQAPGFFMGMRKVIDKLYINKQDRIEAYQRHLEFYNSEFALIGGPLIMGLVIAMEEDKANGGEVDGSAISAMKASLMGPLAGIGDTLRQGMLIPIVGSIAISIGQTGNLLGPVFYMVVMLAICFVFSYWVFREAHSRGSNFVSSVFTGKKIEKAMTLITTVGAITIGALAATTVKLSTTAVITLGDSQLNLQTDLFDAIVKNILPFGLVMLVLYFLNKKVNINWIIVGIFVFAVVCGILGIV